MIKKNQPKQEPVQESKPKAVNLFDQAQNENNNHDNDNQNNALGTDYQDDYQADNDNQQYDAETLFDSITNDPNGKQKFSDVIRQASQLSGINITETQINEILSNKDQFIQLMNLNFYKDLMLFLVLVGK
jgi:hypothetical protein